MDRRSTLAALFGVKKEKNTDRSAKTPFFTLNTGLEPFTGEWDFEKAAHLLRRATYGPAYPIIQDAVEDGLQATIDKLFENLPLPEPPVNYYFEEDPNVPVGSTWIDAPYSQEVNLFQHRYRSLNGWTIGLMLQEGVSIREKMTLFWHNHFSVANVNDPKFRYRYINLLRSYALGNFRDLIKDITIDPAMLRFLNGNQNTKNAPNENYARELLELFTIGKGPQIGPGDYTNYTEDDVLAIAKVLTGWRDRGYRTQNPEVMMTSEFVPNRHDTTTKTLSEHFNNAEIPDMGPNEYEFLIDTIFQQNEVAKFICRKLYRWFVYYTIDDNAEVNVIEPMAQMLIDNDYEVEPVLRALLSSAHFFDIISIGPLIKNPMDFLISTLKVPQVAIPPVDNLFNRYNVWRLIYNLTGNMEMIYYAPPSVAGWKAYYQEPGYYRIWINATTLQARMPFTDRMTSNGYTYGGQNIKVDSLHLMTLLNDPYNPDSVIQEFVKMFFPQPITDGQHAVLKETLLAGQPDYEWTIEYSDYEANPDNSGLAESIASRLDNVLKAMLAMPEFYLS
ncbi:MAG: DUF1800 domain-containing protein [Bacteroidetes bacterium]|nr:MAG: DUF1800 domain-containing protein [Bacteroidota bacterium]